MRHSCRRREEGSVGITCAKKMETCVRYCVLSTFDISLLQSNDHFTLADGLAVYHRAILGSL